MQWRRVFAFSILGLLASASVYSGAQSATAPALDRIVSSLQQRQADNRAVARPYTVVREYRLFSSESAEKPDSVVVARVQFLPPDTTQYSILSSTGSSRAVGIVRRILNDESEIKKEPQTYGINRDNYTFASEGEQVIDGHRCYVLALQPRRKDQRLLEGRAWIDAETFQVRLVQGQPAKSPSWWLKKVQLTMHYGDIGGIWAPVSTQAVAEVRWFGTRVFTSREVSGSVGSTVAETHAPRNLPQRDRLTPAGKRGVGHSASAVPTVVGIDVPQF